MAAYLIPTPPEGSLQNIIWEVTYPNKAKSSRLSRPCFSRSHLGPFRYWSSACAVTWQPRHGGPATASPSTSGPLHLLFILAWTLSLGRASIFLSSGDQFFKWQHLRNIFYLKQAFWFPIFPTAYSCRITYSNSYFLLSLFTVCLWATGGS